MVSVSAKTSVLLMNECFAYKSSHQGFYLITASLYLNQTWTIVYIGREHTFYVHIYHELL